MLKPKTVIVSVAVLTGLYSVVLIARGQPWGVVVFLTLVFPWILFVVYCVLGLLLAIVKEAMEWSGKPRGSGGRASSDPFENARD